MNLSLRTALLFAVLSCAACSSSSSTDSGSFTSSYCSVVAGCCGKAGLPSDGATCRAFVGAFAASSRYDANAAKACTDELNAKSGDPHFCDAILGNSTEVDLSACNGVFSGGGTTGTVAPGGDCNNTSDCAASSDGKVNCAYGFTTGGGTIRKCQVQIKGKANDSPCVGTVDGNITSFSDSSDVPPRGYLCNIADGLYCDSTSHACTQLAAIGATCNPSTSTSCVKEGYCDFASKTCIARASTGQSCSSSTCVSDDYCDTATSTCMAKTPDGGACTDGSKCASGSCVNSKCSGGGLGTFFLCGGN